MFLPSTVMLLINVKLIISLGLIISFEDFQNPFSLAGKLRISRKQDRYSLTKRHEAEVLISLDTVGFELEIKKMTASKGRLKTKFT